MIDERTFLAAVVQLHCREGRPPRAIDVAHVVGAAEALSEKNVERTISLMQNVRARATMKRCCKLHKQLWEEYQHASTQDNAQ